MAVSNGEWWAGGREAVVERQERMPPEGGDHGFLSSDRTVERICLQMSTGCTV
jgi:hypothetical protein